MQHRPRDAQLGGSASDAEVGCPFKVFDGDVEGFLSEPSSIGPCPCQPRAHALGDPGALELGNRGQDMHLELPGRGRSVDPFRQRDKRHAEGLELVEQGHQVFQAAAQPVQSPADQDIEPPALEIR